MKKGNIAQEKSDSAKTNMNINYMIIQAREQVNEAIQNLMSKDQNLNNLQIEKMNKQVAAEYKNPNAVFGNDEAAVSNDSDDSSDDIDDELNDTERLKKLQAKLEERRKKLQRQKINIGSISLISSKDPGNSPAIESASPLEPKTVKNVVFNVRSLRSLQNNIGVFSI